MWYKPLHFDARSKQPQILIKKHTDMKYTVVIVETLSRKVEVDAADAQEAKQIIAEQYNNEQIVLSADDFYGYEIETL